MKLFFGTRFFVNTSEASKVQAAHGEVTRWIEGAISVTQDPAFVGIALNVEADNADTLTMLTKKFPEVLVIPVTPWGKFVTPLNALLQASLASGAEGTLLASAGFAPTHARVSPLVQELDKNTLVVGASLYGHNLSPGIHTNVSGTHCPWNTFGLWRNEFLGPFGFQLGGDMPHDRKNAGVEEVLTVSVIQKMFGSDIRKAKLMEIQAVNDRPDMTNWDDARKSAESLKIGSKDERPRNQLSWAHLEGPVVCHLG